MKFIGVDSPPNKYAETAFQHYLEDLDDDTGDPDFF